jgi:hypothetical protein
MKKLLLATAALVAMTVASTAGTITFMVQEDNGPTTTLNTGQDSATIGPFAVGDFNLGSLSGSTDPFLTLPFLLQANQIDVGSTTTVAHTLHLTVLGVGLTAPTGLSTLASGFDVTGISTGWTAAISTDINGTTVGSHTFFGPLSNGTDQDFLNFTLPSVFTASIHFDISNGGVAGEANTGAALGAVAVPGPIVGAGIPGILAAFGMGGWAWRRRKQIG